MAFTDFHIHTLWSDGSATTLEMIRTAHHNGASAVAITDHCGVGGLRALVEQLSRDVELAQRHWGIVSIAGVELTHIPPIVIPDIAMEAKFVGIKLVVVHGEGAVGVEPGTNLAAVGSAHVDILAHPGALTEEVTETAHRNGVYIELSGRSCYRDANAQVASIGITANAPLIISSNAHDPGEILTEALADQLAEEAGLTGEMARRVLVESPQNLMQRLKMPPLPLR